MADVDKTKLSQIRKQNKKLRERARHAEDNLKDDFLNFRTVFQEMGEVLGLDGTFVAHFGTDHLFRKLESIMGQMDDLEATLFTIINMEGKPSEDIAFIARFMLVNHLRWKHTDNFEDTHAHLQNRRPAP